MKTCPKCQMQYDEEIIRFCTKDGTPLVSEEKPSFIAMPSESIEAENNQEDEFGEETVIRRNRPANIPPPVPPFDPQKPIGRVPSEEPRQEFQPETKQRVVIPIGEEKKQEVRPAQAAQPSHYSQPRKSNTGLVVALTLLGTLAVLGGGIGVWWFLGRSGGSTVANTNVNSNSNIFIPNTNQDANFDSNNPLGNFNIGTNGNINAISNVNTNANINRTPTPKPSQTPKPSPTPNANTNVNANTGNTNTAPTPANIVITPGNNGPIITGTPTPTPKPTPTPTAPPQNVNVGVINSRAANLVKPAYPQAARQMGASGQVQVAVSVDENGNVISARATSGHPLLRQAAEAAARQSRFNPVRVGDRTVKASGTIVYNFIKE